MAAAHDAYPDLALDKISGTDPDQDAQSFIQLIERKIIFALGDAPGDACELENYTFRKKALFSFLLLGPAAEWYENNITNATTWEMVRTNFITRFSDGRNKFRYRMEVDYCIRGDREEIRNFLHRIKRTVGKSWRDDMNGFEAVFIVNNDCRLDNTSWTFVGLGPKKLWAISSFSLLVFWNMILRTLRLKVWQDHLKDSFSKSSQLYKMISFGVVPPKKVLLTRVEHFRWH